MRAGCLLLGVVAFSVQPVLAQTTTADGVQALIRGDTRAALRILQPLAEGTPTPDPIAQFFLATIYESGIGRRADRLRACGLYRSAAKPENPLASQALQLSQAMRDQMGPLADSFCSARAWRTAPPTSFALGADHSVRFEQDGATVYYKGSERRTSWQMGGNGWVFPPMRYSPLDVSTPSAARRHFIESFVWMPRETGDQTTWSLAWMLMEVSGAELSTVTADPQILTVTSLEPPRPFDPSSVVRLSLDANGEPQWAIVSGPKQRSSVIPPKVVR
jgi:hypothetical protein